MVDTRPDLTKRWRALEREGMRFRVTLYQCRFSLGMCADMFGFSQEEYQVIGMNVPISAENEREVLETFEYWVERDAHKHILR